VGKPVTVKDVAVVPAAGNAPMSYAPRELPTHTWYSVAPGALFHWKSWLDPASVVPFAGLVKEAGLAQPLLTVPAPVLRNVTLAVHPAVIVKVGVIVTLSGVPVPFAPV
jgi:hypothetical protein